MSGECLAHTSGSAYLAGTFSVVYVTTPDEEAAKKLAYGLVTNKLAACVHIIPKITTICEGQGKINEDSEALMMIKTRTTKIDELTEFVRKNHGDHGECGVISTPITNGNEAYLKWVGEIVPASQCN